MNCILGKNTGKAQPQARGDTQARHKISTEAVKQHWRRQSCSLLTTGGCVQSRKDWQTPHYVGLKSHTQSETGDTLSQPVIFRSRTIIELERSQKEEEIETDLSVGERRMTDTAKMLRKSQSDRKCQTEEVMFRDEVRKWSSSLPHMELLTHYRLGNTSERFAICSAALESRQGCILLGCCPSDSSLESDAGVFC